MLGYDTKQLVAGGLMGLCHYYMWYELWARSDRYFQLGEDLVEPYYTFLELRCSENRTLQACVHGKSGRQRIDFGF